MGVLPLLLELPLSAFRKTALILPPLKMLCQSRNIPQAFISPLLRMWLWVCAACSCGRDISCPAWAAAALCPTKIRVDAGLSWEVLLCLSYSFSSGCHDSPLWKSLFILSGNLSCQTSWLVPTESKQIPPLRLEVVGESKPCNNCCLAGLWSIEQKSVVFFLRGLNLSKGRAWQ